MAFCKYCGNQLEDGQVCNCAQSQAAQAAAAEASAAQATAGTAEQPQQQQATAAAAAAVQSTMNVAVQDLKTYIPRYFKDPAQAVRSVVEKDDMTFTLVLAVIRVLAMGLAVFGLLNKICGDVGKLAMTLGATFGANLGTGISASFFSCLLQGLLIAVVAMGAFTLMVFALTRLQKGTASIKAVFEVCTCNGLLTSALLLVAFVLSFLSLQLCIIFLLLACVTWMISGVLSAQLLCADNKSGKFWLLYIVGAVLVFVIGWYVIPNFILNAIGQISITVAGITTKLEVGLNQFKAELASVGGLSGLINQLMQELAYDLF